MTKICDNSFSNNSAFKEFIVNNVLCECIFDDSFKTLLNERYEEMENMTCDIPERSYENFPLNEKFEAVRNLHNLGLDLPIWISGGNEDFLKDDIYKERFVSNPNLNHKRIMLVGIEPHRNEQKDGTISLSSPWGIHSSEYCKKKASNAAFILHFISLLVRNGADLYATDYLKFYGLADSNNDGNYVREILNDNQTFIEQTKRCLENEMQIVMPDYVIFLGQTIKKWQKKIVKPSFNAINQHHEIFINHPNSFRKGFTEEKKLKYYEDKIKKL